jgi:glucose-6-phosphate isomerase
MPPRSIAERQSLLLFDQQAAVDAAIEELQERDFVRRAWARDPGAWTESGAAAKSISNRLGWLDSTERLIEQLPEIFEFTDEVRNANFTHAVVLGMGGSSLCPEVFRQTFSVRDGYLKLEVLDSTDPRAVRRIASVSDPENTLYIVSSKSGTTAETSAFLAYFWEEVAQAKGDEAGENFIAITDPGTPLAELAEERGFRRRFLNPPDIGEPYSALSYFGIIPAALMGIDITELLRRARRLAESCTPEVPLEQNPGAVLGAVMGALALTERNKVTFVCSPQIEPLGLWLEQLIAESTGKEGTGAIPITDEPLGHPQDYGGDRLFVCLRLAGHADPEQDRRMAALQAARHPQVHISLSDPLDLGQEFFRWELAIATAGSILNINPFDEPNVRESQDNTVRLLREFESHGTLPRPEPSVSSRGVSLMNGHSAGACEGTDGLLRKLREFIRQVQPGDYVALLAYLDTTEANADQMRRIRLLIRDRLRVATTAGFGPRCLHSTGQLHKGGPNSGVYIQITSSDCVDEPVPGRSYSFKTLIDAQALGDLQALQQHRRRVIRLDVGRDVAAGFTALESALREALP